MTDYGPPNTDRTTSNTAAEHVTDHVGLNRAHYREAVHAVDFDDGSRTDQQILDAAVAACATHGVRRLILDPTKTYTLTATWDLDYEIEVDGGGRGRTSRAGYAPRDRAIITTASALNPMIRSNVKHFAGIRGCIIDGAATGLTGIFFDSAFYPAIYECSFERLTTGVKMGACQQGRIINCGFTSITGWGLDALDSYATNHQYYGCNILYSESNEYKGGASGGAIRIEGIMTSVNDDFENGSFSSDEYLITVGGGVGGEVGSLSMYSPYFELGKGSKSVKAIKVLNSSKLSLHDVEAFGDVSDTGAVFLNVVAPKSIRINGGAISRFHDMLTGNIASNTALIINPVSWANYTNLDSFTFESAADTRLVVLPGTELIGA